VSAKKMSELNEFCQRNGLHEPTLKRSLDLFLQLKRLVAMRFNTNDHTLTIEQMLDSLQPPTPVDHCCAATAAPPRPTQSLAGGRRAAAAGDTVRAFGFDREESAPGHRGHRQSRR
jgi:hypothetical protein